MKKTIFSGTLFLALILVLGCSVLGGWKKYISNEGGFAVSMPGAPTSQKIILPTDFGQTYLYVFLLNRKDDNCAYSVSYVDYPAELFQKKSTDRILEDARLGAIRNIQGKLVSESPISLKGNPGKEFIIESGNGEIVVKARVFLVKQRFYELMVTTSKQKSTSFDIKKFLDSFRLL
ncbi:MAG: hypothetical protein PHS93_01805 [Candidatus Omnitrophica bacterium]|nr:hypothetical protein [Candidatus Omnitrophota bacterium]MDD5351887.1 hypothetical protein [Candidatus Omnitrophota bacterium]MDD5550713.1 hypothetical protein [Candidatus Omnitrophota bacterium]